MEIYIVVLVTVNNEFVLL